ncbi:MAG: type II toxin-antitoxin system HicA family toxin [Pyrinomonadaceae bacterium]
MKLPRNISGQDLAKALKLLGYSITRQTGSHMRLATSEQGQHHISIPQHDPLRIGTLASIVSEVASHFSLSREELTERLFGAKY